MPPPAPRCSAWQRQLRLLGHRLRLAGRRDAVRGPALTALFRGVNAWLRAVGTDHWLAYGTLLGWYREKAILPHDTDVDFGAPLAAYEVLRYAGGRLPPGFVLRDSSHRHHGPKLYVTYAGWEADLYFYAEADGLMRSTERSRNPGETEPFPRGSFSRWPRANCSAPRFPCPRNPRLSCATTTVIWAPTRSAIP
jgi:hypothetical protein